MGNLLLQKENIFTPGSNSAQGYVATQATNAGVAHTRQLWPNGPVFLDKQVPQLTALTLKALDIIQEINISCTDFPILITGSFARCLQNMCSVFNDIDIICATEKSARILCEKLRALITDKGSDIPKSIVIWEVPGCQEIRLPNGFNIHLKDGDFGIKAMGLQVSVDARVVHENAPQLAVHVHGVQRPVQCLSFTEETRLLNDTLEYLAESLDPLTVRLQKGEVFKIPRTILFNAPQNSNERIYGLLLRCLLTLNKARQFITLNCAGNPGKPDCRSHQLQKEQLRLYALTENLHMKLTSHVCRNDFEHRINNWLSTTQSVNDCPTDKKEFIQALLAIMHA